MPFDPSSFFVVHPSLNGSTFSGQSQVSIYDIRQVGYAVRDKNQKLFPAQTPAYLIVSVDSKNLLPDGWLEDINVFWCGYEQNKTRYSMLAGASGPSIMLTATMDGCSFGIGHSASDGSIIVTHANSAQSQTGIGDTKGMEIAQQSSIKKFFKITPQSLKYTLKPNDYRWMKDSMTKKKVFGASASLYGVREKNHWRFYRHVYEAGAGDYTYLGTKRVK
ncbi:MAG: hypothetical protein KGQ79_04860 [Proteobacteria bacterium]|nr:hypothetical protein [Pseudomonadota bacterium]